MSSARPRSTTSPRSSPPTPRRSSPCSSDEIKAQRNFPLLCQTLQSLARLLRFPWDAERPLTQLFRERYFDAAGKFEDDEIPDGDTSPWFTRRARFSSQLPLEYAYAAWGQLPAPEPDDRFAPFRTVTHGRSACPAHRPARRRRAHRRRSAPEPMGHEGVVRSLESDRTSKTSPSNFAIALDEFITIERHVELGAWKHERAVSPERRVLSGASMLARYHEADQPPRSLQFNRALYDWDMLTEEEKEGTPKPKWPEGRQSHSLRVDLTGVACSVEHALVAVGSRCGRRVVISPRWAVDTRKPVAERNALHPDGAPACSMAPAATIVDIGYADDGRWRTYTYIDVEIGSFGSEDHRVHLQSAVRGFEPGGLLTLDASPTDWYGSFQRAVVTGLREGKRNALFERITGHGPETLEPDPLRSTVRHDSSQGLQALEAAGLLHGFEESKQRLIGGSGGCADPAGAGAARHRQEPDRRLRHPRPNPGRHGRGRDCRW